MRSDNSLCVHSMDAILRKCARPIVAKFTIFTALMVVILVGNCYATQIIDSFDVGTQFLMVIPGMSSTASSMNTGIPTSEVMGGSRDVAMECIAGDGITTATVDFIDTNKLNFGEGPDTQAKLSLIWDGDTTPGLNGYNLGINLKEGYCTGLVADIASIDLPIWFRVEVYTDELNASFFENEMPGGTSGLQYVAFDEFKVLSGSGANFDEKVGAIKLIIDGTKYPDTDLSINYVATGVPEPTSFMLLLYGSLCLGLGIWWRKK